MLTSNDALMTKVYAESKGYFKDEFVSFFLPKQRQKKMFPIINRGTWARVYSIRSIILRFMNAYAGKSKVNVLSLGAGYDSTFFWLRQTLGIEKTTADRLHWIEVDFADVVKKKEEVILARDKLADMIGVFDFSTGNIIAPGYKLFASDVRDGEILKARFIENGVDRSLPTLLITECLMIYMTGKDSTGVYSWIRDFFTGDLASVNYEMINPDDPFGRMMVQNLEERGCQLLGISDCPSVEA
jgi:O-methyltransferase involved in polyketide biosynthesis